MCDWVCDKERNACRKGAVVTERDGFQIQITLPSDFRSFSSVSAPPVFCCMTWHRANRSTVTTLADTQHLSESQFVNHSYVYLYTSRHVWEKSGSVIDVNTSPRLRLDPDGTLHISQTWSGDIGTYTCRVTSVGGNDSRSAHLRVRSAFFFFFCLTPPLSSHAFWIFSLLFTSDQDMMDGCFFHCGGLSLHFSLIHQTL